MEYPQSTKLSLEHQFYYVSSKEQAKKASKEQLLDLFDLLLVSYLAQQEYYRALVKTNWGLDEPNKRYDKEELEHSGSDS